MRVVDAVFPLGAWTRDSRVDELDTRLKTYLWTREAVIATSELEKNIFALSR